MKNQTLIKIELKELYKYKKSLNPSHTPKSLYRDIDSEIKALSFVDKNYNEEKVKKYYNDLLRKKHNLFTTIYRHGGNSTLNQYYLETDLNIKIVTIKDVLGIA